MNKLSVNILIINYSLYVGSHYCKQRIILNKKANSIKILILLFILMLSLDRFNIKNNLISLAVINHTFYYI
jgi:hypothetical protein